MSRKKSIVSSFGQFTDFTGDRSDPKPDQEPLKPEMVRRVPAGVIGATQRSMTEIREERDRLLAEAEKGQQLLALDPNDIDPSPFRDRLPDDDASDYLLFKTSLKEEGQKTPISVRRHPDDEHRYQVVFGHRRWRALKELGLPVEAKLGEFTDRDLVVAQGIENASRQDLSWIEKALFSSEMENAGIKAKDIRAALSVDDAQLSKFRQVTRALPSEFIEIIGRAPKIGRPRWLDLVNLLKGSADIATIRNTLSADKVLQLSSDERFMLALSALVGSNVKRKNVKQSQNLEMGSFARVSFGKRDVRFVIQTEHAQEFKDFMAAEIEGLKTRFLKSIKRK